MHALAKWRELRKRKRNADIRQHRQIAARIHKRRTAVHITPDDAHHFAFAKITQLLLERGKRIDTHELGRYPFYEFRKLLFPARILDEQVAGLQQVGKNPW